MLKLKKLAVTGNVAAGKSTVCQYFKTLGAYTVDADKIAHRFLLSSTLKKKITDSHIIENKKITRKTLAKEVFKNKKKLRKLEKLIHPLILKKLKKLYERVKKQNKYKLFVVEMALLFEIGIKKDFDFILTVISDKKERIKRFKGNFYEEREKRFWPMLKKAKQSDFVVYNNSTLASLKQQTKKIYKKINKIR